MHAYFSVTLSAGGNDTKSVNDSWGCRKLGERIINCCNKNLDCMHHCLMLLQKWQQLMCSPLFDLENAPISE